MTNQRDDGVLVILTPFSRSQNDFKCSRRNLHIFRPKLIAYINLSKVLDNYWSRCKCTGGDSRGGTGLVGGHQFFSEKRFYFFIYRWLRECMFTRRVGQIFVSMNLTSMKQLITIFRVGVS